MTGPTKLGAPALDRLIMACLFVREAFDAEPYLVGSALASNPKDGYRDVDVRVLLPDERFKALFETDHVPHAGAHPLKILMESAIAEYLTRVTALPVDFQIQQFTDANARFKGERMPLSFLLRGDKPI